MSKAYSTYILHCKTSVHAGDGSSTGTIDSPIQREVSTNLPTFRDSTLRGAIREFFERDVNENIKEHFKSKNKEEKVDLNENSQLFLAAFGKKTDGEMASALEILPAKLLFFPIRSLKGVFAYVTCPFLVNRFVEEMKLFHNKEIELTLPQISDEQYWASDSLLINNTLVLNEFPFTKIENQAENSLKSLLDELVFDGNSRLQTHSAIISDTMFTYMARMFTDKVTRNKINIETGVADDTGLFNEEYLPEESILFHTIGFSNQLIATGGKTDNEIQAYIDESLNKTFFQLGGNKSIGKGLLGTTRIFNPENEAANGNN